MSEPMLTLSREQIEELRDFMLTVCEFPREGRQRFIALCTMALSSNAMREALETAARWHDEQAEQSMNNLSCGSENWEYRQAHAEADKHRALARDLRRAAQEASE